MMGTNTYFHTQLTFDIDLYQECGLFLTTGMPVKFHNAHGRSIPEVGTGNGFDIKAYKSRGVSQPSLLTGNS